MAEDCKARLKSTSKVNALPSMVLGEMQNSSGRVGSHSLWYHMSMVTSAIGYQFSHQNSSAESKNVSRDSVSTYLVWDCLSPPEALKLLFKVPETRK